MKLINEELKVLEGALKKQATKMDALRAKITALEATNAELEKVNADLLCKFLKVFLFLKNYQLLYSFVAKLN